jgi:ZIP family zinc transporter
VLLGIGSAGTTTIGGLVAIRVADRRHLVLGASGGVILGVVAFDLLPEAFENSHASLFGLPGVSVLLAVGFLSIHVVEKAVTLHQGNRHGEHRDDLRVLGLLSGSALVGHSFLDGLGIGVSASAGAAVLSAVAIAVLAHDFADGFNTYTLTAMFGNGRRRAASVLAADALAPIAGAALGSTTTLPSGTRALYLAYFAGFLLYIATCNILPEAHADHPAWGTLAATVLGTTLIGVVLSFIR